jgi:hypothetical protein
LAGGAEDEWPRVEGWGAKTEGAAQVVAETDLTAKRVLSWVCREYFWRKAEEG